MRVLSGVQPSGPLHIGNYFGAIRQFVQLQDKGDCFYFIADLHALTTVRQGEVLRRLIREVAAGFIALGLDPARNVLYRQSAIPETTELMWILSSITTMSLLQRAHSYKDKVAQGIVPSHGLFAYPVLMAADILIVESNLVPVGKDQKQHLEIARDLATTFNNEYQADLLTLPDPLIMESVAVIPGVDGRKMSKSYGNTIDIFAKEKVVRKRIMSMVTDSTPVESPKPKESSLYGLLKLFAPPEDLPWVEGAFDEGGTGYGTMKLRLFEYFLQTFGEARGRFEELQGDPAELDRILEQGALRAREVACALLGRVRGAVGL